MKYTLLILLLGISTLVKAQNSYTATLLGNRAIISTSDGQTVGLPSNTVVGILTDQRVYVWTPERALYFPYNSILVNTVQPTSNTDAVSKLNNLIASATTGTTNTGGTTTVTQSSATFGTTNPVATTYTGVGTISTTNKLAVVLYNRGSANGTYTLNGTTVTIVPNDVIRFSVILDLTTNKYAPIGTLTVDGTGTTLVAQVISTQ